MHLESHISVKLGNLDQVREHLRGLLGPHELVTGDSSGRVDFWHRSAAFGQFSFNEFAYGRDVVTAAELSTEYYIIIFTVNGHISVRHRVKDFRAAAGSVYVVSPERFKSWVSADCRQLVIRIGAEPLHRYLEQYYDLKIDVPLE